MFKDKTTHLKDGMLGALGKVCRAERLQEEIGAIL